MKIVVIGGTGLIGKKLVNKLTAKGHEVIAAAPSTGVDILTGTGLAEAFNGAQAVVDVSNSPSFEEAAVLNFFETSTRNIVAAEKAAGVAHFVALSVVGADRLGSGGYMRGKIVQESLIKASGVPFTIVRATQFFEFLGPIADTATQGDTVRLPSGLMQPMAADDVAAALADVVLGKPANDIIEVAGPERLPMAEFGRKVLAAKHDPRTVIADSSATYYGYTIDDKSLNPGTQNPRIAPTRIDNWLRSTATSK
jgi:uncharacterized protein YbjT (DUF2867 family)